MAGRLRGRVARAPEVTVVTVGDTAVGKTALIQRFCNDTFPQSHTATSFSRYQKESVVAGRRVEYTVWDTSGLRGPCTSRTLAYREADVFLLCYRISDPSSLFSAINHWVPELRHHAPATPILLVGCASDERNGTGRTGAIVSSQQALAMSQQVEAVMYVETSAMTSARGVASVMEVAALASLGQFSPHPASMARLQMPPSPLPPSPLISKKQRNRSLSLSRRAAEARREVAEGVSVAPELGLTRESSRESLLTLEPVPAFWEQFSSPGGSPRCPPSSSPSSPGLLRGKTGSLSSVSMRSKSSTLSSTRSDSSMQSVKRDVTTKQAPISIVTNSAKTPKTSRKAGEKGAEKGEKMITIKCQRLTADKTYEEVEIEVPAPVYETLQGREGEANRGRERRGAGGLAETLGTRIKCLFSKTAQ